MNPIYTYSIDATDRIRSVSGDFLSFARENTALEIEQDTFVGRSLYDFLVGLELKELYGLLIAQVRTGAREKVVPFRCDSPSLRRFMELRITRLDDDGVNFESTLLRQEPRDRVELLVHSWARNDHLLRMCSWCKKVDLHGDWVEVETAIQSLGLFNAVLLPNITHGMCDPCLEAVTGDLSPLD